jgi:hypothetical protein
MKKVFDFGKIDINGTGRKINAVTVEADLKDTGKGPEFFASAYVWNGSHTDIVMGGQCLDELAKYIHTPEFKKILRFWRLYHLNGRHAGTQAQEQALINAGITDWANEYEKACDYLKSVGLYEVENDGEPYKFGHGWLYWAIPESDLNGIKELLGGEK